MLRGLAHLALWADDVAAAKEWYTGVLGVPPYFERTGPDGALAYIEFRIGDHPDELAVISTEFRPGGPTPAGGGAVASWTSTMRERSMPGCSTRGRPCSNRRSTGRPGSSAPQWWTRSATSWG
ncbi:VOC family protein [Nocardiopsis coralliicola]